jgi:integrase
MKLTQSAANGLTLPAGKADAIFFDDDYPGFGLRLRAGGKRSWIFQYGIGKKQRRMTLGVVSAVTLAQARKTAGDLHARVRLGEDPAASRKEGRVRAADTFEATLRIYLPEKKAALKASSYRCTERHLLTYAKPFHGLGLALVTRRDIGTLLAGLAATSGNATANRTRASLSGFYAWAMQRGLVELNPVIGSHVAPEAPRERVLSLEELAAIWRASGDNSFGAIIRLLIITGCRANEIGGLRLDEVRDDMIILPADRVKNGRAHLVPLAGAAQAILAAVPRGRHGDHLFASGGFRSWSYGKLRLDARLVAAGLRSAPWTIHDLRRSAATGLADLGVQPHIVEAVLNHVSGHKSGVAGIYNRASYEREKTAALTLWSAHLLAAVEGRKSNVVSMSA